jgi:glycosyltransferase involved in cell wall biosynthesis
VDASVILTTYNHPRLLALALEGMLHQIDRDFELVIADDGSGEETKQVIDAFRARAPFPVIHAWHEHSGSCRAAVRNRGIRACTTEYCIFCDGDCIPGRDFVELHRRNRGKGSFLLGGYLRLTQAYSAAVTPEKVAAQDFVHQMTPERRRQLWQRHAASWFYNFVGVKDRPHIAGANFSAWKADLAAVNGFNENFIGWGREESDLRTRLRRHGLKGKSLWTTCIVYHQWHPIDPTKADVQRNVDYYLVSSRQARCVNGLVKDRE